MSAHLITDEEAVVLRDALLERGELTFPLGKRVAPYLCGVITGIQSSGKYRRTLIDLVFARVSDGFASVLAFVLWIGPQNIIVTYGQFAGDSKMRFKMVLKPNKALKCGPSGPDAASLRRLI